MTALHYIDPRFMAIMSAAVIISFAFAMIQMVRGQKTSFFWSGIFISINDPRFLGTFADVSLSIVFLYAWIVSTWIYSTRGIDRSNYLAFISINHLWILFSSFVYIALVSLLNGSAASMTRFILILGPYILLLPIGKELAFQSSSYSQGGRLLLRGFQLGFFIYVGLTHIFAPGKVTGALGDISVSATIIGIQCGYAIFITLYMLINKRNLKIRLVDYCLICFFTISLLLTLSRGPLVATVFAAAIFVVVILPNYGSKVSNKKYLMIFSIVFAIIIYLLFNISDVAHKRNIFISDDLVGSITDQFLASRYDYILQVVNFDKLVFADLLFGNGIGASEQIARSHGLYRIETFWLEAVYDIGIVGTTLLIVGIFLNGFRRRSKLSCSNSGFRQLYLGIILFTLILSPTSFGWFLQGSTGVVYIMIMYLGCSIKCSDLRQPAWNDDRCQPVVVTPK